MILALALLKWGADPPPVHCRQLRLFKRRSSRITMHSLQATLPSYFSDWLRVYRNSNWFIYYHYCPAFNDALLLEYLVLSNKHS